MLNIFNILFALFLICVVYNLSIEHQNHNRFKEVYKDSMEKQDGHYQISDMIRAMIVTESPEEIIEVYKLVKKIKGIHIIEVEDKLEKLQNITIKFAYRNKCIGEI